MGKRRPRMKSVTKAVAPVERTERRGGPRLNAGRKPGTIGKRLQGIREITTDIVKSGKVPLRLMIKNMIYYDERATYIQEELETALAENMRRFHPDTFQKCLELMVKLGDMRMTAQKCAVDAAPYLHPRLSAIELKGDITLSPRQIKPDEDVQRFADEFRQLRSRPFIEQPDVEVQQEEGEEA